MHFAPKCESTGLLCEPWGAQTAFRPLCLRFRAPRPLRVLLLLASPAVHMAFALASALGFAWHGVVHPCHGEEAAGTAPEGCQQRSGAGNRRGRGSSRRPRSAPAHLPTAGLAARVPEVSRGFVPCRKYCCGFEAREQSKHEAPCQKKKKNLRRTAGVKLEEGRFLPWAERAALPSLPRNERSRLRRLGHLFGAFLDCAFCLQGCRTQISPCNISPARRLPSPAASAPISSSGSQARRRR